MKRTLQICVCTHGVKRFSIFRTFLCKHNSKEETLKFENMEISLQRFGTEIIEDTAAYSVKILRNILDKRYGN